MYFSHVVGRMAGFKSRARGVGYAGTWCACAAPSAKYMKQGCFQQPHVATCDSLLTPVRAAGRAGDVWALPEELRVWERAEDRGRPGALGGQPVRGAAAAVRRAAAGAAGRALLRVPGLLRRPVVPGRLLVRAPAGHAPPLCRTISSTTITGRAVCLSLGRPGLCWGLVLLRGKQTGHLASYIWHVTCMPSGSLAQWVA